MIRINAVVMALLLGLPGAQALADCWSSGDKADLAFDELDGRTPISFRDAVSCEPVRGAKVQIEGQTYETDDRGEVRIDTQGMDDRRLLLKFDKNGYVPYQTDLVVAFGSLIRSRFAVSRQLEIGNLRFVLTWGARPRDLDLHLTGPGFHISYQDMRSYENQARLDRDARYGNGPETITLARARDSASYEVFVVNYSGEARIDRQASVSIYAEGRLYREVRLPDTDADRVPVARIQGGRILVE